eukprot:1161337-Pelagomonas_calceolata.AAC.7
MPGTPYGRKANTLSGGTEFCLNYVLRGTHLDMKLVYFACRPCLIGTSPEENHYRGRVFQAGSCINHAYLQFSSVKGSQTQGTGGRII